MVEQKEEEQEHQQAEPVLFSLSVLRDASLSSPVLQHHRLSSVVPFARDLAGRFPSCAFHFHLAPDVTLDAIRDLEAAVRPRRLQFTKYTFNAVIEEELEEGKEEEVELEVQGKSGSAASDDIGSAPQSDGGPANDDVPNQIPARGTGEELIGVTVLGSKDRGKGRVGAFMSHAAESSSARKRSSSRISKLTPIQKPKIKVPKNEAKRPLIEAFNTEVWPLLVAKGWHVEPTKRKPDSFFFFPPGVTKKDGKMREDYFDSKRQVIDAIQNSKDYKADLKEIASLRLKMWEEEALGARYTVHFEMGGTVSLSPVELRRDYHLVWGDTFPTLLPITRAAIKDGGCCYPTKRKGRKRKRNVRVSRGDDSVSRPTIPSNLEWAIVLMRFATLWEHSKPELVVATASSLGASKVETCLSTLRASMDDNKRKKRAEIGILYWESDEHFCANACSLPGPGHWHSDGRLIAWQPGIARQILGSHDHCYTDHVSQRLQLVKNDGFGTGSDEIILDGFLRCAGILEVERPLLKPITDELKCEMNGEKGKIEKIVNSSRGETEMGGDRKTCKVKHVNIFADIMEEITPAALHICKAKRAKGSVWKGIKICALCLDSIKDKDRLQLECRMCKSCFHGWCLRDPSVSKGFNANKQDLVKGHGSSFLCSWCQANGRTSEDVSQMVSARRAVDYMTALRGAYLRFACSADVLV